MDLNGLRSYLSKLYPDIDTNLSYLYKIRTVRFDVDERGNVSGKIQEGIVFRHRDSEAEINAGEIWVCELQENFGKRQYFAKGIVKVDNQFLYDLTKEQLMPLAHKVWEDNRDIIEGMILEENKDLIESRVQQAIDGYESESQFKIAELESQVEELKRHKEQLAAVSQSKIAELEARVSQLTKEKEELDGMLTMSDSLIAELKDEVSKQRGIISGCQNEIIQLNARMKDMKKATVQPMDKDSIIRMHPDTLYSKSFEDGKYSVFLSADKFTMLIERNEFGKVDCKDCTMRLGGLNDALPFENVERFQFISDNKGKMRVRLTCAEA